MPYIKKEKRRKLERAAEILAFEIVAAAEESTDFAGNLNYALTRLIQEIPRELEATGKTSSELRYWIQPLFYGVLLDVALEHKRRVNTSYEAAQIEKNGDCYDTPYFTQLVEVVNAKGERVGLQEVMVERSLGTEKPGKIVLDK